MNGLRASLDELTALAAIMTTGEAPRALVVICPPATILAAVAGQGATSGILAGGPNLAVFVTNYAANKEAAFKFIKYLAQAKTIDLYVELSQTEPSNHQDADPSVITNRLLREQAERLKSSKAVYPFDNIMPQPVIDLFYRVNATVFTGQQTAEDAVAQLQAEFDKQA